MRMVRWIIPLLLIVARPAFAGFEGYIEMKLQMQDGSGTMKGYISSVGARTEVEARVLQTAGMPAQMTMVLKFSNPDVVYVLNQTAKTYTEFNVKDARDVTRNRPEKTYTIKKLGRGTVAGYACEHLLLTANDGGETEVWMSKELVDLAVFREYMRRNRQSADVLGMMQALKEAGVEGFLAKMISRDPKTGTPAMTMELVKAEKRPVTASMFEIPAGYKKQAGILGLLPLPQEHQDTLNKAMERLTPEQRKMLENLMQHKGSGQ
jgi:hypothetical protein